MVSMDIMTRMSERRGLHVTSYSVYTFEFQLYVYKKVHWC